MHPDAEFRAALAVIELKDDRERYLIMPGIAAALPTEIVMETIYTAINRQRVVFLWPVRLPAADGRVNEWHRSAREAADRAMDRWIRVVAQHDVRRLRDHRGAGQDAPTRNGRITVPGIAAHWLPGPDRRQSRSSRPQAAARRMLDDAAVSPCRGRRF